MVILIGGATCTGKTLMAQRLLELHKMPYLSIDHLKMGLIRGTDGCGFTACDSDEIIAERLWPILKGIIMTNIENKQNIIIEGCYLPPDKIKDFEDEYLKHIISVYIGFSKNYIEKNYESGIIGHRGEIEVRAYGPDESKEQYIFMHERQKILCGENRAVYFEIDEDYNKEIAGIYAWIDDKIREGVGWKYGETDI